MDLRPLFIYHLPTSRLVSREQIIEQILRQHSHLTLHAVVEEQSRGNRRSVKASSPPPLARMKRSILYLHLLLVKTRNLEKARVQAMEALCRIQLILDVQDLAAAYASAKLGRLLGMINPRVC